MDIIFQALVIGIVQGLTEFLPISSSGHLILVPYLLGWTDPFINSLAFSVMLHLGTLVALLVYFWRDWARLVPAGLAALRDRSFRGDPDRRLAWLIAATLPPAVVLGVLLNDFFEEKVRQPLLVAAMLVVGAGNPLGGRSCRPQVRADRTTSGSAARSGSAAPRPSPSCPGSAGPGSASAPACSAWA